MVNAWGHDDRPETPGLHTRFERAEVTGEVGDEHFRDFYGKEVGQRFNPKTLRLEGRHEEVVGLYFASMLNRSPRVERFAPTMRVRRDQALACTGGWSYSILRT